MLLNSFVKKITALC